MLSNGKWKDYWSLFDYEHRTIMLLDIGKYTKNKKVKIKALQVGNPNKSSFEFNVSIQWYNHIDIHDTHAKWGCLILNHTWHFRTTHYENRDDLSNCVSVNESKNIQISLSIINYQYQLYNSISFKSYHYLLVPFFNFLLT